MIPKIKETRKSEFPCYACNNSLHGTRHRVEFVTGYCRMTVTVCDTCTQLDSETILYLMSFNGKGA